MENERLRAGTISYLTIARTALREAILKVAKDPEYSEQMLDELKEARATVSQHQTTLREEAADDEE